MLHLLWPFFNNNWPLPNDLFRYATCAMLRWAHQKGIEVGIFYALHTFVQQLNQHPHIHVSVTRGGLDIKHGTWRQLFFKKRGRANLAQRHGLSAARQLLAHQSRRPVGSRPYP